MKLFEGKRVILWATPRALETDGARELSAVTEALGRLGCQVEVLTSERPTAVAERLAPSSRVRRGGQREPSLSRASSQRENSTRRPDLILAHVCNKCRAPLEMLTRSNEHAHLPPVVLLATALDMPVYLEGMRRGAFDCVSLPLQEKEFIRILTRALQERVLEQTT